MRTIARLSGVTLSNIYNYFRDKDTLFRAVLQPLLDAFGDLLARHNSDYYLTTDVYSMKSYQEHMLNEFMRLPQHFRAELRLLLFHAAGSSLEHFRDDFCERQTREGIRYIRLMKERYPDRVTGDVSPFFLRTVSSSWARLSATTNFRRPTSSVSFRNTWPSAPPAGRRCWGCEKRETHRTMLCDQYDMNGKSDA